MPGCRRSSCNASSVPGLIPCLIERSRFHDLRVVGEVLAIVVATWLLLGWRFQPITQVDGSVLVAPYTHSALAAGADWTNHLYRFGVIGGSEMHAFGGTTPIVQLCALLGLSTTATLNVVTLAIQILLGFFAIQGVESMSGRRTTVVMRIATVWLAGFAPVVGWRLGIGHENLILGLLPLVAAMSLVWAARAGSISPTLIAMSVIAVANGVSGLGAQTVVYGAVFGAPFAIATIVTSPRGTRWTRRHWLALAIVVGSAFLMLPRIAPMLSHAVGDDASRALGDSVVYSYGGQTALDWLGSLAWTSAVIDRADAHERNVPIGPIIVVIIALWPKGSSRRALWALVAAALLAIALASDVAPISTLLLKLVPPLESFRVPARAMLPVVILLPTLAPAAVWQRAPDAGDRHIEWGSVVVGVASIGLFGAVVGPRLGVVREVIAWLACIAIVIPRLRRALVPGIVVVAALGVCAFSERIPRGVPVDPIEDGPTRLHDALASTLHDLATPLDRVELVDTTSPYHMSMAFAADLPSLDGVWYPPKRFLDLLGATSGKPVPSTTCVFNLGRSRNFSVLQQLYNVRYRISIHDNSIETLPATNGAAWFPVHVATIDDPQQMMRDLSDRNLRDALATTAWQLTRDHGPTTSDCPGVRVTDVHVDDLGQTATFSVTPHPTECTLVVATTYTSILHAHANGASTAVFPVDISLTGVTVPANATTVILTPTVDIPMWAWLGFVAGITLVVGASALLLRAKVA